MDIDQTNYLLDLTANDNYNIGIDFDKGHKIMKFHPINYPGDSIKELRNLIKLDQMWILFELIKSNGDLICFCFDYYMFVLVDKKIHGMKYKKLTPINGIEIFSYELIENFDNVVIKKMKINPDLMENIKIKEEVEAVLKLRYLNSL